MRRDEGGVAGKINEGEKQLDAVRESKRKVVAASKEGSEAPQGAGLRGAHCNGHSVLNWGPAKARKGIKINDTGLHRGKYAANRRRGGWERGAEGGGLEGLSEKG